MFGGNPGGREGKDSRLRLGDFWKLQLVRPSRPEVGRVKGIFFFLIGKKMGKKRYVFQVLRRCRLSLRECRYREMALGTGGGGAKVAAGRFLQAELAELVDHGDPKERRRVCGKKKKVDRASKVHKFCLSRSSSNYWRRRCSSPTRRRDPRQPPPPPPPPPPASRRIHSPNPIPDMP